MAQPQRFRHIVSIPDWTQSAVGYEWNSGQLDENGDEVVLPMPGTGQKIGAICGVEFVPEPGRDPMKDQLCPNCAKKAKQRGWEEEPPPART